MNVLISQNHGLGDTVQFSIVLKHLRKYRPEWTVFAEMTLGKHTGFRNLCGGVFVRGERPNNIKFDRVISLKWFEAEHGYPNIPSGKVTRSLLEEFDIQPDESLFRYQIDPESSHIKAVKQYVKTLPESKGMVLLHYQGTSSPQQKNLSHEDMREVCRHLIKNGYLPVILDWDARSPLPDQRTIFNPDKYHPMWGGTGTGCLSTLTALISEAVLFVGVDSGPLHAAGATNTPTIGVWTRHHPIHFYELGEVKHLVPKDHRRLIKHRDRQQAEDYFNAKYKYAPYSEVRAGMMQAISEQLSIPAYSGNPMIDATLLRSKAYNRNYYEQHRLAGCDYAAFGDWQREYGRWSADCMNWRGKRVLEMGCACGAIVQGLRENGVKPSGIDLNEHTINLGRNQWPDMDLHVGDAVNMHMFEDGEFDGIHSHQVLEHLKPELVPFVLSELNRVSKSGSTFFAVLDTQDSFNRQNRDGHNEDPTHLCIRPMEWWSDMLRLTGWKECKNEYRKDMEGHVCNFLSKYDWDWFVTRKM